MNERAIQKAEYHGRLAVVSRTTLKAILEQRAEDFKAAIPPAGTLTVRGLIVSALLAAGKNRTILACTQASVLESVMKAARLGLDPGGTLGSAYLVPFKGQCQLIIGYRGLLDLSRRAAKTVAIDCQLVYEGDKILIQQGTQPRVEHVPDLRSKRDNDAIIGTYVVVDYRDSDKQTVEYMPKAEIDGIRQRSKAADRGPWVTDYGQMARKTVLRRACKFLPISVVEAGRVLAEAIEHDNATSGLDRGAGLDEASRRSRTEALAAHMQPQESAPSPEQIDVTPSEVPPAESQAPPAEADPPLGEGPDDPF